MLKKFFVKELWVRNYTKEGFKILPVTESICYFTLFSQDWEAYEKYHSLVRKKHNSKDQHTTERFLKLLVKLLYNGYDIATPIKIVYRDGKPEIIDGQHRAAIICSLNKDIEILAEVS